MFKIPFRFLRAQRSPLGVLLAALFALAVIVGGQALVVAAPVAHAATVEVPVSPEKHTFTDAVARPMDTLEFRIEKDSTINELSFKLEGGGFLQSYSLSVNGQNLPPKITRADSPQKAPLVEHKNLNIAVQQGDKVSLGLHYTQPKVTGSVALTLRGTLPESPEEPGTTEVTPAAPTFVDPSTAEKCLKKGYVTIPETTGVEYFIDGVKKTAGRHDYEGTSPGVVRVEAVALPGYVLSPNADFQWKFTFSGSAGQCDDPEDPPQTGQAREFTAVGHDFPVTADPVDITRPDLFTARVNENSQFKYAKVRVESDASFLTPQAYELIVDQIGLEGEGAAGVSLRKQNVDVNGGVITFDVVPVKDGKQIDLAYIPEGSVFSFTNNLSENRRLKVALDIYGEKLEADEPGIISPPDGAEWVEGRVRNPPLPQRCGLRVAVVADLSTSLRYADRDGFADSKKAANALIDALAGTPTELGIYNFSSAGPQVPDASTFGQNPPYLSMKTAAEVQKAKNLVSRWNSDGSTNWEAGLKQVKSGDYDVVYFITDGMPTLSSKSSSLKLDGSFVQESALNQAIHSANELKSSGTRVVPIMVDLTLGGKSSARHTVTEDLVFKNIRPYPRNGHPTEPGLYYYLQKSPEIAKYIGNNTNTVNLKLAHEAGALHIIEVDAKRKRTEVTSNQTKWTYGSRGVKLMGEDISGTGDTVRVKQYSELANQMKKIGQELALRCEGQIKVRKRIVDENGTVIKDGADGWEFSLTAKDAVIDNGSTKLVRQSAKKTSTSTDDPGTASWRIESDQSQILTLTETQQQGYSIFKRDNTLDSTGPFNAVCTEELRNGVKKNIPVENVGEFGFKVTMNSSNSTLSSISCVVDNVQTPTTTKGTLTFKKAQYVDGRVQELDGLGGATFEIYPSAGDKPDFSVGPKYTINPNQTSIEVDSAGTFYLVETQAPEGLNLLPKPVAFEIGQDQKTKEFTISVVGGKSPVLAASGKGQAMILTVTDTKSGELPKSGGRGFLVWALLGTILTVGGVYWTRRRVGA